MSAIQCRGLVAETGGAALVFVFFFQAEDGIRDVAVTGVQTCALPILTVQDGRDRGVRFRDVDHDGRCELIVGNESQNAVFGWSPAEKTWKKLAYALPRGAAVVDAAGGDNGLRFVDVNEDGCPDVLLSNEQEFSL